MLTTISSSLPAYITWTVDPNLFDGFITIRWYGLLFASSFMLGYYLLKKIFKDENIPNEWLDSALMYVMIGTVLGARLGHVLFYDAHFYFVEDPWTAINLLGMSISFPRFLAVWEGGLASHGAAIGIIIALWLYSKKITKKSLLWVLDRVVLTVMLGAVFIRLGNLMNHEIIGIPTEVPWAFKFTRVDYVPRHPAQLYESISYLLAFVFMYFIAFKRWNYQEKLGNLFGLFLVLNFTIRFLIEFVKNSQGGFETVLGNTLSTGQWLSIPFVLIGTYFLFVYKPKG